MNVLIDKIQKVPAMMSFEDKALVLYKKLLHIMEQEEKEISEKKLDCIDHYMSQKIEILKEIEEVKTDEQWLQNSKLQEELSGVIKKIIDLNEANALALRDIKHGIQHELSDLHKSRSAYNAYNSQK